MQNVLHSTQFVAAREDFLVGQAIRLSLPAVASLVVAGLLGGAGYSACGPLLAGSAAWKGGCGHDCPPHDNRQCTSPRGRRLHPYGGGSALPCSAASCE